MPFKSQAQRGLFYAKAERGEMPKSTVDEWEKETPKGKKLPYHIKKKAYHQGKIACLQKLGFSADEFAEFAKQDDTDNVADPSISQDQLDRRINKSPAWSGASSLEAGDAGTRNHQMGLPRFGGV